MKKIFVIAKNTFKETIRDRILYGIVIFSIIFLASTVVLGSLSLGEDITITRNFGLAGIYLFGLIITIFLGASLIYKEVEKKTIYFVLSKPVTGLDIILGKFFGLLASVTLTIFIMTIAYLGVVGLNGGGFDYLAIVAVIMQVFEMALLIAILILLSIFSAPLSATIYTILLVYIGHSLSLILVYAQKNTGMVSGAILKAAYYVLPNLEKFNIRNLVIHNKGVSFSEVLFSACYTIFYSIFALYMAQALFKRKDL